MNYKRILTIQDISCVGQCSLTVALPILSACGLETAILPSAVLSTHTAGFSGFTFRDLTEDIPLIKEHWVKENIKFEAIYTGYLGSIAQIDMVKDVCNKTLTSGGKLIVDPAMADNGKLYSIFNDEYVEAMKGLCAIADYVVPNLTEACFLTGIEYKEVYDFKYIDAVTDGLLKLGAKNLVLTGISFREGYTGVLVIENGVKNYYEHVKLPNSCHGTGDIYASAFVGAMMQDKPAFESAKIAADYVLECIKCTGKDTDHWYGAKFEPVLDKLISALK
ncbi:MAG: pyridoxamine kinase [Clostridia bacterium]|nr:pyridoxamine kinase [Clostridia bacterium]